MFCYLFIISNEIIYYNTKKNTCVDFKRANRNELYKAIKLELLHSELLLCFKCNSKLFK